MLLESAVVQLLSCGFCIQRGRSCILHLVINLRHLLMSVDLGWTLRKRKRTDVATAWPQPMVGTGTDVRLYTKPPIILSVMS